MREKRSFTHLSKFFGRRLSHPADRNTSLVRSRVSLETGSLLHQPPLSGDRQTQGLYRGIQKEGEDREAAAPALAPRQSSEYCPPFCQGRSLSSLTVCCNKSPWRSLDWQSRPVFCFLPMSKSHPEQSSFERHVHTSVVVGVGVCWR